MVVSKRDGLILSTTTAREVLAHAEQGKRVAIVVRDRRAADYAIIDLVDNTSQEQYRGLKVIHSRQRVELGSGRITFHSPRTIDRGSTRGESLDLVYLERALKTRQILEYITPSLAVRAGEIVEYDET